MNRPLKRRARLKGSRGRKTRSGGLSELRRGDVFCRTLRHAYGAAAAELPELSGQGLTCESRRDSVPKPRVARNELPWVAVEKTLNSEGVASPGRTKRIPVCNLSQLSQISERWRFASRPDERFAHTVGGAENMHIPAQFELL
jgi:hypothetical protein